MMSHIVLSRKLRPRKFDDVIGQDVVVKSLRNSIARNRIGHAYIFSGTRGVGKTSIARIFAKALNCKNRDEKSNPCLVCENCISIDNSSSLDYLEIDGASHNSVDDVREIINNVHTLPTTGQYKVYIIDEVHMLSISAFNALLKTLEEPPAHVVFILATTEPEKLPKTVLSRCQRYDFKHVSISLLVDFINNVAKKEGISFTSESLVLKLCRHGKGSIRDTLSLLDQVLSFTDNQQVNDSIIASSLGLADDATIERIVHSILNGNERELSNAIDEVYVSNIPLEHIYIPLLDNIYNLITLNEEIKTDSKIIPQEEVIWIFEGLSRDIQQLEKSSIADKMLAIALIKYCKRRAFLGLGHSDHAEETVKKKFDSTKFLAWLNKNNPGLWTQLEHGNLVDSAWVDDRLSISWGFSSASSIFAENVSEEHNQKNLQDALKEFTGDKKITIVINILKDQKIVSVAEIKAEEKKQEKIRLAEKFKSHEGVKEAERLFSTQIEKIKIYDQEN